MSISKPQSKMSRRRALNTSGAYILTGTTVLLATQGLVGCAPAPEGTFLIPIDVDAAQNKVRIDESVVVPAGTRKVMLFLRTPGYKFYFSNGTEKPTSKKYQVPRIQAGDGPRQILPKPFLGDGRWAEAPVKLAAKEFLKITVFAERTKRATPEPVEKGVDILGEGDCGGSGSLLID